MLHALANSTGRLLLERAGKEADNFFNVLIVVAFTVFTVEIIAASLGDRSYLFSFFFYLDAGMHSS